MKNETVYNFNPSGLPQYEMILIVEGSYEGEELMKHMNEAYQCFINSKKNPELKYTIQEFKKAFDKAIEDLGK